MFYFDFDELEALELEMSTEVCMQVAESLPEETVTEASGITSGLSEWITRGALGLVCGTRAWRQSSGASTELEAVEVASCSATDELAKSNPVKTVDPDTRNKIQQALAEAIGRRRKEAGLAEKDVGDSDLTMKIQQAVADARLRQENSEPPKELTRIEEAFSNALAGARERQQANQWHDRKSGSTYGSWWPSTAAKTGTCWNSPATDDGWDQPFQVGPKQMTKEARVQFGQACMDAKVLDDELKKVVDDAKARQSQTYAGPEHSPRTAARIQNAQMIAESRSYVAFQILKARRNAPYQLDDGKKEPIEGLVQDTDDSKDDKCQDARCVVCSPRAQDQSEALSTSAQKASLVAPTTKSPARTRKWVPVTESAAPVWKRVDCWADESDSECEAEGASPRQRGGG